MKKSLLLLVIALIKILFIEKAYSQTAYYDAISLRNYIINDSGQIPDPPPATTSHPRGLRFKNSQADYKAILSILSLYTDSVDKKHFHLNTNVVNAFSSNPFIANYLPGPPASSENIQSSGNIASSIGGLNVTSLADGVSKFLIKRAKEELFISLISKIQDTTQFPEFPKLFPNTMALMKTFNSWEYSNVINTLKEAFDKDLQQLLGNIPQLNSLKLDTTHLTYKKQVIDRVIAIKKFLATPEARIYISAMQTGNGFITGQKIPDIIDTISGEGYLGNIPGASPDVKNAISLFDIISHSIRSNVSGVNYVSYNDIASLDPVSKNLYLGLLWQQFENKKIKIGNVTLTEVVTLTNNNNLVTYIDSLASQGGALKNAYNNLSAAKKKGEKDLTIYWAAIFDSANQFLQSSTNISMIEPTLKFPQKIQDAINYSTQTLQIGHDIAIRNYSAAIVGINSFIPNSPQNKAFKEFFVKYGSFAANIVEAQNSDDVEQAIESVALPVGSYSVKQNSQNNISLNGYVGYALDYNSNGLFANGVYAPVGFSFNRGSSFLFGAPMTIFVSAFDLGSLVSYRLANGATDQLSQEIKLESIISPSLQAFFEIPKTPIAIGAGWKLTPKMVYTSNTSFMVVNPTSLVSVSILIDIPIFTLHNKPKN